jgi:hypothetical protein
VTADESSIASIERTALVSVARDLEGRLYYGHWKFTVAFNLFQLDINRIPCLQEQNANEKPRLGHDRARQKNVGFMKEFLCQVQGLNY